MASEAGLARWFRMTSMFATAPRRWASPTRCATCRSIRRKAEPFMSSRFHSVLASLAALISASAAQAAGLPHALRVCADPDNLPYSHADGSGFENRLAVLVAKELALPVEFTWMPLRRGFVRKTAGEGLCD